MRNDDTCERALLGLTAPARKDLSFCDDRTGCLLRRTFFHIEDAVFPNKLSRCCIEREYVVISARIDNRIAVNGDVAVDARYGQYFGDVFLPLTLVLPNQIAGRRIHRLNQIAWVGQIHHAPINERSRLLNARTHTPGPDHPQTTNVRAIDLVQWTVAPAVQGAAPHQPIGGRRILKHLVRNGNEAWRGLLCDGMEAGQQQYQRCNNECYAFHVDVVSTLVASVQQEKKVELRFAQERSAQPQFQMLCERPPAAFGGSPPHGACPSNCGPVVTKGWV